MTGKRIEIATVRVFRVLDNATDALVLDWTPDYEEAAAAAGLTENDPPEEQA